ncbi:hypothetical protein TNIN_159521, partial [Trichonephila inaurata madagascariensis]
VDYLRFEVKTNFLTRNQDITRTERNGIRGVVLQNISLGSDVQKE